LDVGRAGVAEFSQNRQGLLQVFPRLVIVTGRVQGRAEITQITCLVVAVADFAAKYERLLELRDGSTIVTRLHVASADTAKGMRLADTVGSLPMQFKGPAAIAYALFGLIETGVGNAETI
jgi:hypothetical protein